ncbi:hypothetical protein KCU64_g7545, partial [Aureobasidium melanogenum]
AQEEAAAQQLKQTLKEAENDGAETNLDAQMADDSAGTESDKEQQTAGDGDVQMA